MLATTVVCTAKSQSKQFGFRYPIRVVEGKKYDLSYLFAHWRTATNAVTNSPWMAVSGKVVGYNGGWIVDGKSLSAAGVETHQMFLLRNPPQSEKDKFDSELAKTIQMNQQDPHYNGAITAENGKQQEYFAKLAAQIPNDGHVYLVDFFVFATGKVDRGMPVMDFGLISN
jgi:hypothetical protein